EMFHTWTLVHDDILDHDPLRRGDDTVHERFRRIARERYGEISDAEADHYGLSIAILAGDVQHGWSISLLTELTRERGLPADLTLYLIERLDNEVLNRLLEGELLDVQYALTPLGELTLEAIEDMLWKKTGILYRYCAEAGALIGLGRVEPDHPHVSHLAEFTSRCGIAFQLQDDLLGVIGDPDSLGKPVGSDIREGKRTAVVHYAYEEASPGERELLERTLGRIDASEADVREVIEILTRRGGVERTRQRAGLHIEAALPHLDALPPSRWRDLLRSWADYMIRRNN
ncbi:MAG TPA: polyprenyl synthetase family protein, partial [Bacteroidetes bacterium]|nr:polyprenyl synthetase family protein [Bacteroidota bacterium]